MDWLAFLTKLNTTILADKQLIKNHALEGHSWLGFSGASEKLIKSVEQKLNATLPPSYKEFLRVSNGFKNINDTIYELLPVEKIDWMRSFDQEFVKIFDKKDEWWVDDEKYFIYGSKQDSVHIRGTYIADSLAISSWGDVAIMFLNPKIKFGNEWEAWIWASWYPGAHRYKSFQEMMVEEYKGYLKVLDQLGGED